MENVKEKEITNGNGGIMLFVIILGFLLSGALMIGSIFMLCEVGDSFFPGGFMLTASFVVMTVLFILCIVWCCGK